MIFEKFGSEKFYEDPKILEFLQEYNANPDKYLCQKSLMKRNLTSSDSVEPKRHNTQDGRIIKT